MRKKWEVALRREGFTASDYSIVCSEHFKQADFDWTGQIVRLRDQLPGSPPKSRCIIIFFIL